MNKKKKKIKKKTRKKMKKNLKKKTLKQNSQKNNFSNALSHHCTDAWVIRPERPKGVKIRFRKCPLKRFPDIL